MFLELLLWFTDERYLVEPATATGTAQATGLVHNFTTIVARVVPSRCGKTSHTVFTDPV